MVLKVKFVDFPWDFNPNDNFFSRLLERKYDLEISDRPDILFYGNYGNEHFEYRCFKIYYSSENVKPDYCFCDVSFSYEYTSPFKNCRLPLFVLHCDLEDLTKKADLEVIKKDKIKFCNFVYSNEKGKERNEFFRLLNRYKKIDSPGKVYNNMESKLVGVRYDYESKRRFLNQYKFTIAFENESSIGYTTEKIIHPMQVNSIPIYFVNPKISNDFNPDSFINVHDFSSFAEVIELIIKLDNDDNLYNSILRQPYFLGNRVPYEFSNNYYFYVLEEIISRLNLITPVSKTLKGKFCLLNYRFKSDIASMRRMLRRFYTVT